MSDLSESMQCCIAFLGDRSTYRQLKASPNLPRDSVAIVTPHQAQRTLLKMQHAEYYGEDAPITIIDTVERLQGGERPTVIVSATASDPIAISKNVEFILDLNRSNVAFSRTKQRLIVLCSNNLLEYIPPELEDYEDTMLWKALHSLCCKLVAVKTIGEHIAQIFMPEMLRMSSP